jgi:uncharacterized FlaG/YvyC family protein
VSANEKMAETGFNPTPVTGIPPVVKREASVDKPREDDQRVPPVLKQDAPNRTQNRIDEQKRGQSEKQHSVEVRADEIDELAKSALKNSRLSITREGESGDFIYLMVDQDTGETVRRWPPEKHSDLVDYLRSKRAGLIDKTV